MSQRYVEFLKLVDVLRTGVLSSDDARKLKQDPDWKLKEAFLKVLHEELYEEFFEGIKNNVFAVLIPELAHSSAASETSAYAKATHIKTHNVEAVRSKTPVRAPSSKTTSKTTPRAASAKRATTSASVSATA